MGHRLTFTKEDGFLHFRVEGPNTVAATRAYIAEMRTTCQQEKCSVALVEENLTGPSINLLEVFAIVSSEVPKAWPWVTQVAFVDVNPEHSWENRAFAEDVAVNRGLMMRVFQTIPEAREWLIKTATQRLNAPK